MNQVFKKTLFVLCLQFLALPSHDILAGKKNTCSQTPPKFELPQFAPLKKSYKVCIVIPAYNEENRISQTIEEFVCYFKTIKKLTTTFLIVANNCSDNTVPICKALQKKHNNVQLMNLKPGGKGFAVKQGFLKALQGNYDLVGFVDADLATTPPYFYELITKINGFDGAVASRYAKGARVWPQRPFVKRVGGKIYNWILRQRCNINIRDTQCGAKIFTYDTIKKVAPLMEDEGWAFDLELIYLARLFDKTICEVPTTWSDMPGSHLTISGCTSEFISAPGRIKKRHKELAVSLKKEKRQAKKNKRKKGKAKRTKRKR